MLRAVAPDSNPKRQRERQVVASLTFRAGMECASLSRGQHGRLFKRFLRR